MTGSNRRPPACKAGALPAELIPLSLKLDNRRQTALLGRLHTSRYAALPRALSGLVLKLYRLIDVPQRQKKIHSSSFRPHPPGGSGWARTIDPRLIKTVL